VLRAEGKPRARWRPARGAGTLERGGDLFEGPGPSNEAGIHLKGAMPSSGAGVRCPPPPPPPPGGGGGGGARGGRLMGHGGCQARP
jgi:hypothetical protein